MILIVFGSYPNGPGRYTSSLLSNQGNFQPYRYGDQGSGRQVLHAASKGRSTLGRMTARIGADGHDLLGDPILELLEDVARVEPEPGHDWVHLEKRLHFRSTQRLRIGELADSVVAATWPAEQARQARYLYSDGFGSALVAAAIERGWEVEPLPHIAFPRSSSARRLYMSPPIAPLDYVACWQDEDGFNRIGGRYTREAIERDLWPRLKQQGFADDSDDDDELARFLDMFPGDWRANMRPGLRFRRVWTLAEQAELDSTLAETIRGDFDAEQGRRTHAPAGSSPEPDAS